MIYYNPLCIYKNSEVLVTLENTGLLAQLQVGTDLFERCVGLFTVSTGAAAEEKNVAIVILVIFFTTLCAGANIYK